MKLSDEEIEIAKKKLKLFKEAPSITLTGMEPGTTMSTKCLDDLTDYLYECMKSRGLDPETHAVRCDTWEIINA